jgi:hypothetical protein
MTCEAVRAAMAAGDEAGWPSGLLAHLTECEGCAALAVEWTLRQSPPVAVPASFAADVARRARLAAPSPVPRTRGVTAGLAAAAAVSVLAVAWVGAGHPPALLPAAVLLLAAGEAIALALWSLSDDGFGPRARR